MSDKMVKKPFIVTLPGPYVEALNHLVEDGIYMDPQDVIREALRHLFRFHGVEPFADKGAEIKTEDEPQKCED